jgi:hypothetical protein
VPSSFSKKAYKTKTADGRVIEVWFELPSATSRHAKAFVAANFLSICFERKTNKWSSADASYTSHKAEIIHAIIPLLEGLYKTFLHDLISGESSENANNGNH